jgi:hypothetical protein
MNKIQDIGAKLSSTDDKQAGFAVYCTRGRQGRTSRLFVVGSWVDFVDEALKNLLQKLFKLLEQDTKRQEMVTQLAHAVSTVQLGTVQPSWAMVADVLSHVASMGALEAAALQAVSDKYAALRGLEGETKTLFLTQCMKR